MGHASAHCFAEGVYVGLRGGLKGAVLVLALVPAATLVALPALALGTRVVWINRPTHLGPIICCARAGVQCFA